MKHNKQTDTREEWEKDFGVLCEVLGCTEEEAELRNWLSLERQKVRQETIDILWKIHKNEDSEEDEVFNSALDLALFKIHPCKMPDCELKMVAHNHSHPNCTYSDKSSYEEEGKE